MRWTVDRDRAGGLTFAPVALTRAWTVGDGLALARWSVAGAIIGGALAAALGVVL